MKDTLQKIKENEENIDKFKADFGNAMTKLAQQIAFSMNVDPNMYVLVDTGCPISRPPMRSRECYQSKMW